jgi:single-strand DNA-binding protein
VKGVNEVTLMGNLTRDPEVKETTNGTVVCKFGLATGRSWKDKNGEVQEDTEFHNVIAWSNLGKVAGQYLSKGSPAYIRGRITTRKYTDANQVEKYITEIVASDIVFLPSGNQGAQSGAKPVAKNSQQGQSQDSEYDDYFGL